MHGKEYDPRSNQPLLETAIGQKDIIHPESKNFERKTLRVLFEVIVELYSLIRRKSVVHTRTKRRVISQQRVGKNSESKQYNCHEKFLKSL